VNPLVLVAKALLVAVARHPEVNASWDEARQEIVYHHQVNSGSPPPPRAAWWYPTSRTPPLSTFPN